MLLQSTDVGYRNAAQGMSAMSSAHWTIYLISSWSGQMLVTIETGEKLGICHLSKFLVKRYCQVDGEGEALRLKPPQQDSVADYFVSQVCQDVT